jgi:hypothetical protein
MLLDDIADYLSSGGIGTVGTDLFKGTFPDAPDAAVCVYETGGLPPVHAMNALPGQAVLRRPRVQVVCRAAADDYASARSKAEDVYRLLDGFPHRLINGVQYHWGSAVQEPFPGGRDEKARVLVTCNYDISRAMSA